MYWYGFRAHKRGGMLFMTLESAVFRAHGSSGVFRAHKKDGMNFVSIKEWCAFRARRKNGVHLVPVKN